MSSPQYRRSPRNLKFSQPLATRYEKSFQPHKKSICGWGYIPWKIRIQRQTIRKLLGQRIINEKLQKSQSKSFFCQRFIFTIFSICTEFSSPTRKKITPTQGPNSQPKSQFDLRHCYINLLKNDSIAGGMQTLKSLWICQCIFLIVIKLQKLSY